MDLFSTRCEFPNPAGFIGLAQFNRIVRETMGRLRVLYLQTNFGGQLGEEAEYPIILMLNGEITSECFVFFVEVRNRFTECLILFFELRNGFIELSFEGLIVRFKLHDGIIEFVDCS
jgi:hypothetical protein